MHWYNNGLEQKKYDDGCAPEGWILGMLPETRQKISQSVKALYQDPSSKYNTLEYHEKLAARDKTKQRATLKALWDSPNSPYRTQEREAKKSKAMKAKWANEEYRRMVSGKIRQSLTDENVKAKHSASAKAIRLDPNCVYNTEEYRKNLSAALQNAWQRDSTREKHNESVQSAVKKSNSTKRENGSFNKSSSEDLMYAELIEKYGIDNVKRQYMDDRYPYNCDFYIESEDVFIELNAHWTHGPRPFDPNDTECQELLSKWQSKGTKFYNQAIYVWTDLDIRKKQIADQNNLRYIRIYKEGIF